MLEICVRNLAAALEKFLSLSLVWVVSGGKRRRQSGEAWEVHNLPVHSGLGLGYGCTVRRYPQGDERLRDPVESNCESQKSHCDYFYLTPGGVH